MNIQLIIAKIKQYPIAVGSVVLALALLAGILVRKGGLPDMEQQQETLQNRVNVIRTNAEAAKGLDEQVEQLSGMVETIRARTLRRSELTANVGYFYGFEEPGVLDIESVNQLRSDAGNAPGARDLYETIRFTIQVDTTYDRLVRFTHDLRKGAKIVRIESIGVTPSSPGSERVKASLSIRTLGELPAGSTGRG